MRHKKIEFLILGHIEITILFISLIYDKNNNYITLLLCFLVMSYEFLVVSRKR